jgi:hypothetical protein
MGNPARDQLRIAVRTELRAAKKRVAELELIARKLVEEEIAEQRADEMRNVEQQNVNGDIVWGAEAIGREIGRTAIQVYYLFSKGRLNGAVRKLGTRTMIASRKRLAEIAREK